MTTKKRSGLSRFLAIFGTLLFTLVVGAFAVWGTLASMDIGATAAGAISTMWLIYLCFALSLILLIYQFRS
ncbi:hypothetical protein CLV78_101116 [Aliiruegeria haliotis]|uniref:Uncharacterized protein n=1 Tax=Aliiruegeria haliotis TaxID=1280846 RepID=A0A2T0RYB5_9RHOB|nr:hypothetical protein [Aliiruegeria haliotis]PRY26023.1 hypothetical protein CLV78_101116 [Aliiruegeria haliotis]